MRHLILLSLVFGLFGSLQPHKIYAIYYDNVFDDYQLSSKRGHVYVELPKGGQKIALKPLRASLKIHLIEDRQNGAH